MAKEKEKAIKKSRETKTHPRAKKDERSGKQVEKVAHGILINEK